MLTHLCRPASIGCFHGGFGWRMRRARPLALALLLTLGSSGCATVPRTSPSIPFRPLRAASLDEVLAAYDGYCKGIETLSASGDLDVADLRSRKSQKVSVRLLATRGGGLYLKGSVAFVTALEVVSDGERFWFTVPSKKTVWTGPARGARERVEGDSAPYYALRPHDLIDAYFPEPFSAPTALFIEGDAESFSLAEPAFTAGRGIVRRRVWLARETLELQRFRTYDAHGDVAVEVRFEAWTSGAPRRVEIVRPAEGYRATFRLSKIEKNAAVSERAFSPRNPEGYAVQEIPN
jgi:outer membrane lipoprotein-sorting protein